MNSADLSFGKRIQLKSPGGLNRIREKKIRKYSHSFKSCHLLSTKPTPTLPCTPKCDQCSTNGRELQEPSCNLVLFMETFFTFIK